MRGEGNYNYSIMIHYSYSIMVDYYSMNLLPLQYHELESIGQSADYSCTPCRSHYWVQNNIYNNRRTVYTIMWIHVLVHTTAFPNCHGHGHAETTHVHVAIVRCSILVTIQIPKMVLCIATRKYNLALRPFLSLSCHVYHS